MKSSLEHINYNLGSSINVEKFTNENQCPHVYLHLHNSYEIVYVKNGKGKIKVENSEKVYNDGTLVFLGPNIPHYGFSNQDFVDNFEVVIQFDEVFVNEKLKAFPEFGIFKNLINTANKVILFDDEVKNDLASIFEGVDKNSASDKLIGLLQILSKLSDCEKYETLLFQNISHRYLNNERINIVFDYINSNFDSNISSTDIANKLGLTTNSFCRMFKKITSKSFLDYVNEFRIEKASYLILNTDYTISEIMYISGFNDSSYFSKKFRQYKNKSPKKFRVSNREENKIIN